MKNILITGENGYIGKHIGQWLVNQENKEYKVSYLNVRTDDWKNDSFRGVDAIVHTAGIVHQPQITDWDTYYNINVLLTEHLALKAKNEGVKQFIFLSSMSVYGVGKALKQNVITEKTVCKPTNLYGKSKFEAESALQKLEDTNFHISIVRPPNVYGYKCKGNYIAGFTMAVKKLPMIPYAYSDVKQSMIYIDNLTELVRLIIESEKSGIYMPQDIKPVSAVELMREISRNIGKTDHQSKLLGHIVHLLGFTAIIKKVYGGVQYSEQLSNCFGGKYVICNFDDAMKITVQGRS